MTADYGMRRRSRIGPIGVLTVAALVLGAGTFTVWEARDWLQRQKAAIATASAWHVEGPPCASLTAAEFEARGLKAPKTFEFEGVVMARHHGHVNCAAVRTKGGRGFSSYPVCQFTGPGALRVVTRKGEFLFDIGVGQPATVTTEGGAARCVLASKFRLEGGRLTYS